MHLKGLYSTPHRYLHPCAKCVAIASLSLQNEPNPGVTRMVFVVEEGRGTTIGEKQNVGVAIIIKIAIGGGTSHTEAREGISRLVALLREVPSSPVVKEQSRLRIGDARLATLYVVLNVSIGDQQVLPTIKVIVKEAGSETEIGL